MTLGDYLKYVVHGGTLTREDASRCCELLLSGDASHHEVGALLCALHARGESLDELVGFLAAMRAHMTPVASPVPATIDLCGTGGDGLHSFNLSSAAALLAAACGATVAKHGNRAVSSRSGSADFYEALQIPLSRTSSEAEQLLIETGFAFLFAPYFHPAMKSVAPVRKELGVRTIFNLLGPLANPARVTRQAVGVYNPRWLRPLAETLRDSGSEFVITYHGDGGVDEVTLDGYTHYCVLESGAIREGKWLAQEWGLRSYPLDSIGGGTPAENAARLLAVAQGREPELTAWIIANCAPALLLSGIAATLPNAVSIANDCIASGQFNSYLNTLRAR